MKRKIIKYLLVVILFLSLSSCYQEINEPKRRYKQVTNIHFSNTEMEYLTKMCNDLHINVKDLLIVIENESDFNPKAVNPKSNAVGLIQLMPNTLSDFGLTTNDILSMTTIEQIDVIKKYYSRYKQYNLNTASKLLLCTFYPYALSVTDENYIFGSQSSIWRSRLIAEQNYIYDLNSDGVITLKEFNKYHKNHLLKNY